ncbi:hypothetical protein UFOVP250_210 [uncultured Caudovirales phage]|uniref:Virion structural protein n=1 Tax=uncultured Caudovirales phage TaxID=2100421 RepID=A0A6J5LK49_9CAUD|nr:hypothetical protein UFOVP250_210 [uncultured Caudovirales phage]
MAINYKNYLTSNIGNAPVAVYNPTTPSTIQSTVIGMLIANNTANNLTANVTLTSGSVTANVVRNLVIYSGSSVNVVDSSRLIIGLNNTLSVSASSNVDVILSVIEVS